ncbi:uncharacterized protein MELLADRAFT_59641 [Melampsora larici-populina 98AG31]|uniref:Uncharacterized protein n=1 Tax=Melampsora larici-populina (strain 98AG31 / pathotype 3-4-7) TaxID=747676 RepID=F4R8A0_MELLP|nr:uncharacterized protein MELLADRAFT_59641 [Melampsora larici-populina 98AG31]EGG11650.1 hypothetical protein MELLADRAFT_59641 [Melampsora larici-populina 98AG31]
MVPAPMSTSPKFLFVGVVNTIRSPQKSTSAAHDPNRPDPETSNQTEQANTFALPSLSPGPPIVYDPSGPDGIDGFLDYCSLPPDLHTSTRQLLRDAGVSDFRHINNDDLPAEDLAAKGLNKIAINTLYSNAQKYKKCCIQDRKANQSGR